MRLPAVDRQPKHGSGSRSLPHDSSPLPGPAGYANTPRVGACSLHRCGLREGGPRGMSPSVTTTRTPLDPGCLTWQLPYMAGASERAVLGSDLTRPMDHREHAPARGEDDENEHNRLRTDIIRSERGRWVGRKPKPWRRRRLSCRPTARIPPSSDARVRCRSLT